MMSNIGIYSDAEFESMFSSSENEIANTVYCITARSLFLRLFV